MAVSPRLAIQVTTGGIALATAGASAGAVSAATVIAATGGAAAVVLVGYGIYQSLSASPRRR